MVQIITDSSVLYTEEEARKAGFEAVPLCVHIGDLEGRDLQIDMKEFYHRIEAGQIPMSSQPPIGLSLIHIYDDAAKVILEVNPMPAITSRVCAHFCMEGLSLIHIYNTVYMSEKQKVKEITDKLEASFTGMRFISTAYSKV